MTGYLGKVSSAEPDILGNYSQSEVSSIWGEIPGRIVSFDAEKQTATVKPLYKPQVNGETLEMPELFEVPVRFPRVGGFVVTYPVKQGDKVNLRPQMRSFDNYDAEEGFESFDARTFHLADMQAYLDGGEPVGEAIPNFNSSNMEIRSADGQFAIEMSEEGKFRMRGAEGNFIDLLAQMAELLGGETTTVSGGSSSGIWPLTHQAAFIEIAGKLRAMAI